MTSCIGAKEAMVYPGFELTFAALDRSGYCYLRGILRLRLRMTCTYLAELV